MWTQTPVNDPFRNKENSLEHKDGPSQMPCLVCILISVILCIIPRPPFDQQLNVQAIEGFVTTTVRIIIVHQHQRKYYPLTHNHWFILPALIVIHNMLLMLSLFLFTIIVWPLNVKLVLLLLVLISMMFFLCNTQNRCNLWMKVASHGHWTFIL